MGAAAAVGIQKRLTADLVVVGSHRTAVATAGAEDTCPERIRGRDIAAAVGIVVVAAAPLTTRAAPHSRDGL